jgi:phospholipid transport system transporter-binding protein
VSEPGLAASGDGRWTLSGALDFSTVPDLWSALERLMNDNSELTLSLAGVSRSNSAGLVMLVEAQGLARGGACRLQLVDIPAELHDLADMSGCEHLLDAGSR